MYGREQEVERLVDARSRIVMLAGDPGVGKSQVLTAAQACANIVGAVADPSVTVRRSPAALQIALLEALGSAVALLARDEGLARTAARYLADAARRMADARVDQLASAVGKMLLGIVRARLGGPVADAVEEYAQALSSSVDERLAARISSAGDGDVIDVLAGFAMEVTDLAGDREVVLGLARRLHRRPARGTAVPPLAGRGSGSRGGYFRRVNRRCARPAGGRNHQRRPIARSQHGQGNRRDHAGTPARPDRRTARCRIGLDRQFRPGLHHEVG
jgi:hypothetical protein